MAQMVGMTFISMRVRLKRGIGHFATDNGIPSSDTIRRVISQYRRTSFIVLSFLGSVDCAPHSEKWHCDRWKNRL
ncbi:MAG: hypothetical protein IPO81_25470 [Kouleothrix sp.]|nr:hypothetical protein [Kouleothrix sp.]